MMAPNNQNLANFYGVHKNTIDNYRNGDELKKRLYEAMKRYFIEENKMDEIDIKFKIEVKGIVYDIPNIIGDEETEGFLIVVDKETVIDFKDTNIIKVEVTFPEGCIISRDIENFSVENVNIFDTSKSYSCMGNFVYPDLKAF